MKSYQEIIKRVKEIKKESLLEDKLDYEINYKFSQLEKPNKIFQNNINAIVVTKQKNEATSSLLEWASKRNINVIYFDFYQIEKEMEQASLGLTNERDILRSKNEVIRRVETSLVEKLAEELSVVILDNYTECEKYYRSTILALLDSNERLDQKKESLSANLIFSILVTSNDAKYKYIDSWENERLMPYIDLTR